MDLDPDVARELGRTIARQLDTTGNDLALVIATAALLDDTSRVPDLCAWVDDHTGKINVFAVDGPRLLHVVRNGDTLDGTIYPRAAVRSVTASEYKPHDQFNVYDVAVLRWRIALDNDVVIEPVAPRNHDARDAMRRLVLGLIDN